MGSRWRGRGRVHVDEGFQNKGGEAPICPSERWRPRRHWWAQEGGSLYGRRSRRGGCGQASESASLLYRAGGECDGAGGCCRRDTSWVRFLLRLGRHRQAEGSDGAGGSASSGLLEGRKMRRGGQMVGSTQGRNPVQWGRKKQGMAPDLRGSPEGCCPGCSSLMGWAWLKTGFQGSEWRGNRSGSVCG